MKYFIAGGAGFIGSTLAHRLLQNENNQVVVYDNLSSGKEELIEDLKQNKNFTFIMGDIRNLGQLIFGMLGSDIVYHFASNADIAAAIVDPTIDFHQGTALTQNILEAMRTLGIKKIIYASGSGVYGRVGDFYVSENYHPFLPVSTYGASKIAGEALICAYCHMFDMQGTAYRFANVIGRNSTHGVILDFIRKLKNDSYMLTILGNGQQTKSYIYIDDILNGIEMTLLAFDKPLFDYFNLSTNDQISVEDIALLVEKEMGLTNVIHHYSGKEAQGWRGDVGMIKLDSQKAMDIGWKPNYTTHEAVKKSIREMLGKE